MLEDIITILYWKSMAPNTGGKPIDTLAAAISKDFCSYENFVTTFKSEATKQFGSAWVLVVDKSGKLQVTSTQNQDNPLMKNALIPGTPILALMGTCLLSWLSIPKKKLHRFFFQCNQLAQNSREL
jgi:superoxide dismutase